MVKISIHVSQDGQDQAAKPSVVLDVVDGVASVTSSAPPAVVPLCDQSDAVAEPFPSDFEATATRPHPLIGVKPGNHTRLLQQQRAEAFQPGKPAPVVRSSEEQWAVVDGVEVLPEIRSMFRDGSGVTASFTINGETHTLREGDVPVKMSLAEYLRYNAGLTGTKICCGEGGCGACTVTIEESGVTRVANSCLRPVLSMDGQAVTTTEGLGSTETKLHAIQETISKCDGSQCGMCTPGMVMSIYGHLSKQENLQAGRLSSSVGDAEHSIMGNLCRCTGYRPIYKAIHELCNSSESLCCSKGSHDDFELPARRFLAADGQNIWLNCTQLSEVFAALQTYGSRSHRLVCGNTSTGVVKYYPPHPNDVPNVYINVANVHELRQILPGDSSVVFGASVTISEVMNKLNDLTSSVPGFHVIVEHLKLVAHPQVRDMGSWVGNVMMTKTHKDFGSDICLLLTLLEGVLTLSDGETLTKVSVEDFLAGDELPSSTIITKVEIPFPAADEVVDTYKIMRRHANTHAEVNAGFRFSFDASNNLTSARIVYGNIAKGPLLATQTVSAMVGKPLSSATLKDALAAFEDEAVVAPPSISDPPFVVVDESYRKSLAISLLYKAWLKATVTKLGSDQLDSKILSAAAKYERPISSGSQTYTVDSSNAPVGAAIEKVEGPTQASGQTKYTADMTWPANTCVGAMVMAKEVGTIASIDASAALQVPGVVAFIGADTVEAIGASNSIYGTCYQIFAGSETRHVGEFVGMICANTTTAAAEAAALVQVHFHSSKSRRGATNIKEAKEMGHIVQRHDPIHIPSVASPMVSQSVSGEMSTKGQKHFYMETQVAFVVPDSSGSLMVNCATQSMDMVRTAIARTLNKQANTITLQNVRSGGAYGGKHTLSQPVTVAACVAAVHLQRPVLVPLERSADFQALGGRSPCHAIWTAGFDASHKITSLSQDVTSECGYDKSGAYHATNLNGYDISGVQFTNPTAITAAPVNTIMRAPGEMQGALFMEAVIEQVARTAGVDPMVVQEANLTEGLRPCWEACKEQGMYNAKRSDCVTFNQQNRYRKRGVYMMATDYTFGGYWTEKCVVRVESDGSVSLDHSGLENGQGIHTKVDQVVTKEFQALAADFNMRNCATVLPHSTSNFSWSGVTPTYGSGTSETVCAAISQACQSIAGKLSSFKSAGNWKQIVSAAIAAGVDLSATGKRTPFGESGYKIYAASCISAEVDVLTGEFELLSVDVVHDTGKALNPGIDIGQIEGCVVQSLGSVLHEEMTRSSNDGRLVNCGTWEYKIPSGLDIPVEMNITLLQSDNTSKGNVFGSKMSGEPAMCIGLAGFYAVKDAIYSARHDAGTEGWFQMDSPASVDAIQQACLVDLSH